jgi:hypothetical protein
MRKILFPLIIVILVVIFLIKIKSECQIDSNYCLQDEDCICSENPCFLGNKEYYNKCFLPQQRGIVQACPDACGFGPYELEFKTICENNQCKLASFNRTTGERIG